MQRPTEIVDLKKQLRKQLRRQLAQMSASERQAKGQKISASLKTYLQNGQYDQSSVGVYAPMADEVMWHLAFDDPSSRWLFPAQPAGRTQMSYFQSTLDQLIERPEDFGVSLRVPPTSAQELKPVLVLVPGLGFDLQGGRLGRGKGFYDQYLKEFDGLKIGLCFDFQLVESVPREDHDQLVDAVMTEERFVRMAS